MHQRARFIRGANVKVEAQNVQIRCLFRPFAFSLKHQPQLQLQLLTLVNHQLQYEKSINSRISHQNITFSETTTCKQLCYSSSILQLYCRALIMQRKCKSREHCMKTWKYCTKYLNLSWNFLWPLFMEFWAFNHQILLRTTIH